MKRMTKPTTQTTTTTKEVPFQTTNRPKQNNTCETRIYTCIQQHTTTEKALWPQRDRERGRESALTASHSCHRPRIPFRHVLIELRCAIKHCKRECNKIPFQKHKNKNTRKHETCDPMKLELSYIKKYTTTEGVATEREGEYTYCNSYLSPPPYSIWTRPD